MVIIGLTIASITLASGGLAGGAAADVLVGPSIKASDIDFTAGKSASGNAAAGIAKDAATYLSSVFSKIGSFAKRHKFSKSRNDSFTSFQIQNESGEAFPIKEIYIARSSVASSIG